jgi:hypothetical protein
MQLETESIMQQLEAESIMQQLGAEPIMQQETEPIIMQHAAGGSVHYAEFLVAAANANPFDTCSKLY